MLFFINAKILVTGKTVVKNAEGVKISTFDFENPLEVINADVQPNTLTQMQIDLYGINSKTAETKKCFFESASFMKKGNRAKVVYNDGTEEIYDIQPVNKWPKHSEVLLIPIENE